MESPCPEGRKLGIRVDSGELSLELTSQELGLSQLMISLRILMPEGPF